ncbi:MAG: ATP-binding cassette domain-containing protein [Actinomycetaceae bacterium]|nr:ATP-binding cassette domain-containing protein [Actinomycetaceae bacterium]MDY6083576.1 ATP-binding cassette domain-containing protein [Actinomycetaceae bacterium]
MSSVVLDHATRLFPNNTVPAVNSVNLEVADGEFVVLVGPSGSGKSTLLRMVAGLEPVTSGRILIDGDDVARVPAHDRDVAMVFQSYALYPNMTVAGNMAFALKNAKVPNQTIRERVQFAAKMLQLQDLLNRKPAALSGGQRQRVAMGRAIVRSPRVFAMDEPLSNLDAKLRVATRAQIAMLQQRLGTTTLYVTHDQTEAMTMADRVAVLRGGVMQQVATPTQIYDHPVNMFVAGFIGSPSITFFHASVDQNGVRFGDVHLPVKPELLAALPAEVIVGVRPDDWHVVSATDTPGALRLRVDLVEHLGSESFAYAVPVDESIRFTSGQAEDGGAHDAGTEVEEKPHRVKAFFARTFAAHNPDVDVDEQDTSIQPRVSIALKKHADVEINDVLIAVPSPDELLFFDPSTEKAIYA